MTELVTLMPRSCSTFIQSDVANLFDFFPLTVPASRMAPPKSSSFSVSVVFPASGWEMMANVFLFSISCVRFIKISLLFICCFRDLAGDFCAFRLVHHVEEMDVDFVLPLFCRDTVGQFQAEIDVRDTDDVLLSGIVYIGCVRLARGLNRVRHLLLRSFPFGI